MDVLRRIRERFLNLIMKNVDERLDVDLEAQSPLHGASLFFIKKQTNNK